jgi:hypothetical protein
MAIARQWLSKHIPTAMDMHTTNRGTVGNSVFYMVYVEDIQGGPVGLGQSRE